MKTNGATWKAYLSSWPDGQWYDDCDETWDGREPDDDPRSLHGDSIVEFSCGVVFDSEKDKSGTDITKHFYRWLKQQSTTTLVCLIPNENLEKFRESLKSMSVKEV